MNEPMLSMRPLTVAVLGCGQMGSAFVLGMAKGKVPLTFHTFTPSETRARQLAQQVGGVFHARLEDLPPCDFYLLAFKPQQLANIAPTLAKLLPKGAVVISLLAGVRTLTLIQLLGPDLNVVRAMPNTPCRINQGLTLIYFADQGTSSLGPEEKQTVEAMLRATGATFLLQKEEDFDPLTGVTGSGPALLFEMARSMEESLLNWKVVQPGQARQLVAQVFMGAAHLMKESPGSSFEELRDQVTSKGGITFAALSVLSAGQWQKILGEALEAARKRSLELGQG